MKISDVTYLQFQLIALVDQELHREVSFEELYSAIDGGAVLGWLGSRFQGHLDLSLYSGAKAAEVESAIADAASGLRGRERRKTGVESNGVCLLLSFLTEALQQGDWRSR